MHELELWCDSRSRGTALTRPAILLEESVLLEWKTFRFLFNYILFLYYLHYLYFSNFYVCPTVSYAPEYLLWNCCLFYAIGEAVVNICIPLDLTTRNPDMIFALSGLLLRRGIPEEVGS